MARRELARGFEVAVARRNDTHVRRDRLQHERGDLSGKPPKGILERGRVVVRDDRRQGGERVGDAGTARDRQGRDARAGRHEEGVGMTVIAPLGLDDPRASGGRSGETDRAHRGFRAGVDEPHHLDGRHETDDALGEAHFHLGRRPERRAAARRLRDLPNYERGRVTEEKRSVRHHVVDPRDAVGVGQPRAASSGDEKRLAAHRRERSNRRRNPSRHELRRAAEEGRGSAGGYSGLRASDVRLLRGAASLPRSSRRRPSRGTSERNPRPPGRCRSGSR